MSALRRILLTEKQTQSLRRLIRTAEAERGFFPEFEFGRDDFRQCALVLAKLNRPHPKDPHAR